MQNFSDTSCPAIHACSLVDSSCQDAGYNVGLGRSRVYFRDGKMVAEHQNTCGSQGNIFLSSNLLCVGAEFREGLSRGSLYGIQATTVVGVYLRTDCRPLASILVYQQVPLTHNVCVYE